MSKSRKNIKNSPEAKRLIERILDLMGISEWVSYSNVVRNTLFIVFLVGLGVIHVANTHLAERSIRKMNKKEKELKELRWEYMTLKSNLMYERKQSELADKLIETGITELKEPPKKIVVDKRAY
ncbi:MAG: hypothetical protein GY751_18785 [Bacteroidetes bacterium]|nr:hypothetical protein [Bacteroidota bacterium]